MVFSVITAVLLTLQTLKKYLNMVIINTEKIPKYGDYVLAKFEGKRFHKFHVAIFEGVDMEIGELELRSFRRVKPPHHVFCAKLQ